MSPLPLPDAQTLREGRKFADPRVFPSIVAASAMAMVGLLMFWQRQDARENSAAMVTALREQTAAIKQLTDEIRLADRPRR